MFSNVRFESPYLLLLFIIIPFLIVYELKYKRYPYISFSSVELLKKSQKSKFNIKYLFLTLRLIITSLFIISLSRPQKIINSIEVYNKGISIMIILDTSGSMKAIDLKLNDETVNRLEVIKHVVKNFISKRINDNIGLIVFGTNALTYCPLTTDYNILNHFIDNLEIGMAGESTNIGDSIALGIKRLLNVDSKSKIIILLTDGANNSGKINPEKSSEMASNLGIKIYTIGVGSAGKIPYIQDTFWGPQIVYAESDLDEQLLIKIAEKTKAKYYRAKNTEELEKIYDEINKLEKSNIKSKKYYEYKELFSYFIIVALILLLVELILSNTLFIRIP
ncbi:MAG: aerotolerance protein BatA [Candidatus Sericytochromatia bacterium]|nr:MAG: aerotolerance protein BatA [Candidatus Sericytochromatia bacterium]